MPLALLLLMLAGHDAAQTERTITLRVPEGSRSASDVIAQCELRNSKGEREGQDGRLRRGTGLTWLWSCLPGDLVSCDATGREPVDITAVSCAEPDAPVSLQPARQVVLTSQAGAEPLTLEWLVEKNEGGLQRLAIRSFAAATPLLSVPVGDGKRVLRVHRRSAAPVSIPIEPSPRSQTYKVPPPQAGGEIFGRILPSAVIRPEAVALTGNGISDKSPIDERGYFRFPAIEKAGAYSLAPVYRGPVQGSAIPIEVTLSRSTDVLPLKLPPTGGLSVAVDGTISVPGTGIRASLLEEGRNGAETRRTIRWSTTFDSTVSLHQAEGLQPGKYLIELRAENAVVASALADVHANALTPVVLAQPRITIDGRVTVSGSPAPAGLLMTFAHGEQEWTATTDGDGRVSLAVDKRGRFNVQVRAARYLPAVMRTMNFNDDENTFSLDLPGGLLRVHIRRKDGAPIDEPVQIAVTGPAHLGGFVQPHEASDVLFIGLDYGNYRVTADTQSNLVGGPTDASITKEQPTAAIDLMLENQRSVLHIVDAEGVPVHNAQVLAVAVIPEEPAGSGIYPLRRTPIGTEVLIAAPGFLPTCALAAADDWTVSLLRPSAHVSQVRLTPAPPRAIGEVSGPPISTCPIPVQMLPVRFQRDAEGAVMTINGLPEGQVGYRPRPFMPFSHLVVPGPPISIAVPQVPEPR